MADEPTGPTQGPASPTSARRQTRLVAIAGSNAGQTFTLSLPCVLGRSGGGDVVLADTQVSREHARIECDEAGALWIEDLGSRNGTFVRNVAVERTRLSAGDHIRLGKHTILQLTERDDLEGELLARQRLESMGRLALSIAHDFNNMLGVLHAGLDYVLATPRRKRGQPAVDGCLDDMRAACERAAALSTRLLESARQDPGPHVAVDVSALCREVAAMARRALPRDIAVRTNIEPELIAIGDATSLHQALMNLCLNARDAMPDGGTLTIEARHLASTSSAAPDRIVASVRDTGVGMTAQVRARVCEPFYTTKTAGLGFGLGLASVQEIARNHSGQIEIDSALGKGTELRLVLPSAAVESGQTTRAPVPVASRPPGGGLRVLLADDEAVVRRSVRRLLEREGYQVLEASDGQQAVAMWEMADPKPLVAVLDIDMPGRDGIAALTELRRTAPRVAAVFLAGHADPKRQGQIAALGSAELLLKPHSADALLNAVAGMLTETSDGDAEPTDALAHRGKR